MYLGTEGCLLTRMTERQMLSTNRKHGRLEELHHRCTKRAVRPDVVRASTELSPCCQLRHVITTRMFSVCLVPRVVDAERRLSHASLKDQS